MADETITDLTKGVYRRLYSGFTKGRRINQLSLQAEAWFWRILATVDDFGNGDADPDLCRDATAGGRKTTTTRQVSGWLREMQSVGLIRFYAVKSEPFLHVIGFEMTQPAGKNGRRIRRYPSPDESEGIQEIPDVVSASYSYSDNDNDPYSDTDKRQAPDSPPFSGSAFLEAMNDYEQHRKEKRAKLTPKARDGLYRKLLEMGEVRAVAAIRYSISQGWTGIFEEKNNGTNNGLRRPTASQQNGDQLARNRAVVNELRRQGRGDPDEVAVGNLAAAKR